MLEQRGESSIAAQIVAVFLSFPMNSKLTINDMLEKILENHSSDASK